MTIDDQNLPILHTTKSTALAALKQGYRVMVSRKKEDSHYLTIRPTMYGDPVAALNALDGRIFAFSIFSK